MTQTIDDTLAERGSRYGEFPEHASVTQFIKVAMASGNNWEFGLADDQKECLEMIAHKIGRILNGDPDYIDSWTDIIGYARLVEKRLIAEQTEPTSDRRFSEEAIAAAVADLDGSENEECQCPVCLAEQDWIAKIVGAMNTKPVNLSKPSDDEVEAALNVLLAAGVIRNVEDGNA